ncbi:MAG: hypothetical protein OXN89_24515 [Bryobacterales bacterium]|nr:hypothetical protein [Bryobacterales bacterium]
MLDEESHWERLERMGLLSEALTLLSIVPGPRPGSHCRSPRVR